jgi:hypothetical protein
MGNLKFQRKPWPTVYHVPGHIHTYLPWAQPYHFDYLPPHTHNAAFFVIILALQKHGILFCYFSIFLYVFGYHIILILGFQKHDTLPYYFFSFIFFLFLISRISL